jgi:hypothetical protein
MLGALAPEGWVLLIGALVFICTVAFVLLACRGYRSIAREGSRYPAYEPPRIQTPREPEIDLAKERREFEARRDNYIEQRQLGRVA